MRAIHGGLLDRIGMPAAGGLGRLCRLSVFGAQLPANCTSQRDSTATAGRGGAELRWHHRVLQLPQNIEAGHFDGIFDAVETG